MHLHAGFVGLVEFDRFDHQYRTVIDVLSKRYNLDATISKQEMEAAFRQ